ncbi:MAG: AAA family ATPase [Vulcanimicrobiota bacterium]
MHENGDAPSDKFKFEYGICLNGAHYKKLLSKFKSNFPYQTIEEILYSKALTHNSELTWFPYEMPLGGNLHRSDYIEKSLLMEISNHDIWYQLWKNLTQSSHGSLEEHWVPQSLDKIFQVDEIEKVTLIPAIRHIGEPGTKASDDFSGIGIIDRLAQLQHPRHDRQELKEYFNNINIFLRVVTGSPDAKLEIPYERDTILVNVDNKILPLTSLGTGIHEVIILAAASTILTDQIICMEEPEIHMHPLLQKKLIHYLDSKTTNQYFISTHSAHILDAPGAMIFHVRLEDGTSIVEHVKTDLDRSSICSDLGYRSSDLLQTNCIIWVEGPSDRIYIRKWISTVDSELVEGLHYSIMFYGGRLLNHLTAKDPCIEDFISLRRLNRYVAIVIDSDRTKEEDGINETKERVRKEFTEDPGYVWITAGYTIENYIDHDVLETAIKSIYQQIESLSTYNRFKDPLKCFVPNIAISKLDKVKIAHQIEKMDSIDTNIEDLNEKIHNLVAFIREANGIEEYVREHTPKS